MEEGKYLGMRITFYQDWKLYSAILYLYDHKRDVYVVPSLYAGLKEFTTKEIEQGYLDDISSWYNNKPEKLKSLKLTEK